MEALGDLSVYEPDYLISLEQYHVVVANMMKITQDPGIAFSLSDLANPNDFGIVGYAMISAATLRESLDISQKYSSSLMGRPLRIDTIRETSPGFEIVFSSPSPITGAIHRFECEELHVQGIKITQILTGKQPLIDRISFTYPEPPHHALYRKFFNCPIEFDAPRTVLRILEPELNTPIQNRNQELFSVCVQHCHQVMSALGDTDLLCSHLRSLFLTTPNRLPNIETASATLGMSASTLYRKLDDLGQSYQAIKNGFRFDLAREYLRSGHMPAKQIAYLLGFNSPSTFSRAFKSWSGQTVGQFLKNL